MPEIEDIAEAIQELQVFNRTYAVQAGEEKNEIRKDDRELNLKQIEIHRIRQARDIKPSLGVFGQSQCGKSFLVSELIGGSDASIAIEGVGDKQFQDYNQKNADRESTAVVTRFTNDSRDRGIGPKRIPVRYMSPAEIMWSFVYGFYEQLKTSGGFELDEKAEKDKINEIISSDSSNRLMPDPDFLGNEIVECINWIKERIGHELKLSAYAGDYFQINSSISIEKFIQLASTLWNCDKNITSAFQSRIEILYYMNFPAQGSIPETILRDTLDAKTLMELSLKFSQDRVFPSNDGNIIDDVGGSDKKDLLQNLQTVIKEVILPVNTVDGALVNHMDILDFPGARSLRGQHGSSAAQINKEIINGDYSEILANAYKRGKLLYLFDLYRKYHEITLLLFCSENGPQSAPILRTMLDGWISMNENDSEVSDPRLFTALTKSDKLLFGENDTKEESDNRLTGRFEDNFSNFYGDWVKNYLGSKKPFQNFFLVRNPQAKNNCFDVNSDGLEVWRPGFETGKNVFKKAFMANASVSRFLGDRKSELFEIVFNPDQNGIENLKNKLLERFLKDPKEKIKYLDGKENKVISWMLKNYLNKYYTHGGENALEKEKEFALEFINKLKDSPGSTSKLLHAVHKKCPDDTYLWKKIQECSMPNDVGRVTFTSPLAGALPQFIKSWILRLDQDSELLSRADIGQSEIKKFLSNIQKYLLQEEKLKSLIDDFSGVFNVVQNFSDVKAVRNYVMWYVGERVYYLEHSDYNGTPEQPIHIPEHLDFEETVLDNWLNQLPEIYAGNFQMRKPSKGDGILQNVYNKLTQ